MKKLFIFEVNNVECFSLSKRNLKERYQVVVR